MARPVLNRMKSSAEITRECGLWEDSQEPFDPQAPSGSPLQSAQSAAREALGVHKDPYQHHEPLQEPPQPPVPNENEIKEHESKSKDLTNFSDTVEELTPELISEDQKRLEQKRELARINSRKWHQEWVSKGVPRAAEKPESNDQPRIDPEVAPSPAAAATPAVASSMAKIREKFITEWIEASGLPKSQERFRAACKAWMESDTRAEIMSTRLGVQR